MRIIDWSSDVCSSDLFDPAIAARMRRLRPGQGLRLVDEDGQETAARVAWISPLNSRLLIVNRRGVRKMVVSPEELAALGGNGHASVRAVDAQVGEGGKGREQSGGGKGRGRRWR